MCVSVCVCGWVAKWRVRQEEARTAWSQVARQIAEVPLSRRETRPRTARQLPVVGSSSDSRRVVSVWVMAGMRLLLFVVIFFFFLVPVWGGVAVVVLPSLILLLPPPAASAVYIELVETSALHSDNVPTEMPAPISPRW